MINALYIKLTDSYGDDIWVNLALVSMIKPGPGNDGAHVYFVNADDFIKVEETPKEIVDIARKAMANA